MNRRLLRGVSAAAMLAGLLCLRPPAAFAAATITILNTNAAGVGFNDPSAATPVGGNTGTTIGEQRLIAFQRAADIWGALLDSSVEIRVQASFVPLMCDANSAVLGSAGSIQIVSDFSGARVPGTWYVTALGQQAGRGGRAAGRSEDQRRRHPRQLQLEPGRCQLPGGDGMVLRAGRQPRQQRGPRHGPAARVRPRSGLPDARGSGHRRRESGPARYFRTEHPGHRDRQVLVRHDGRRARGVGGQRASRRLERRARVRRCASHALRGNSADDRELPGQHRRRPPGRHRQLWAAAHGGGPDRPARGGGGSLRRGRERRRPTPAPP